MSGSSDGKRIHEIEYRALAGVAALVRLLPRSWALHCGAGIGQFGWALRLRRRLVLDNVQRALPELLPKDRRRLAARAARNFGRTVVEFLRFDGPDRAHLDDLVELHGLDALRETLAEGRGALVITAHLGAWALYVTALAAAGIPSALLVGRQANAKVDRMIHAIPGDTVIFIPKGRKSVRQIVRCLQDGRCMVMVADQNARKAGTLAPFFGRETSTLGLPGAFVERRDVPLFIMAGRRGASGKHRVDLYPLDVADPGEENLRRYVATRFNHALEEAILQDPDQYFWYHRRWRDEDRLLETSDETPADPTAGGASSNEEISS